MAVRDLEVLTASHSKTPCRCYWLKSEAYESSWRKVLKPTMHCDLDLKNNLVGLPVHHPSLPADLKARSLDGWTSRRGREGKISVLSSLSQVERLSDSHYYTCVYFCHLPIVCCPSAASYGWTFQVETLFSFRLTKWWNFYRGATSYESAWREVRLSKQVCNWGVQ